MLRTNDVKSQITNRGNSGLPEITRVDASWFYRMTTSHSDELFHELGITDKMPYRRPHYMQTGHEGQHFYMEIANNTKLQKDVAEIIRKDENLSELGKKMKEAIQGKVFIDLGCGSPAKSCIPRIVAQLFGANYYVGVDKFQVVDNVVFNEFPGFGDFQSHYVQDDMARYLSQLQTDERVSFYLCGIERSGNYAQKLPPNVRKEHMAKYIDFCMKHIEDIAKPGDSLVIGPRTYGFIPEKYGFNGIHATRKNPEGIIVPTILNEEKYIKFKGLKLDEYVEIGKVLVHRDKLWMLEKYGKSAMSAGPEYWHSIYIKQ